MTITCRLSLPANYRLADLMSFHGRDAQKVAEEVGPDFIRKGLLWQGIPACLNLRFAGNAVEAELHLDGDSPDTSPTQLEGWISRMLGLTQPVDIFEQRFRDHPELGRLIAQNHGLRIPVSASAFEALAWAITGQQISVSAALSIRRKLIQEVNIRHSAGLLCHPGPNEVLALSEDLLRQAGFSRTKAATLHEVSRRVLSGRLRLDQVSDARSAEEITRQLLDTPGIGPWTVNYALLRAYGWLDGSLHGDVAVRRGLQSLLGRPDKLGEKEVERWLAPFTPWRALVAAHLWAWRNPDQQL